MNPHRFSKFRTLLVSGAAAFWATEAQGANGILQGQGTVSSPYLVSDYADLCAIGGVGYSNKAIYRLAADIDASASKTAHAGSGFAPVVLHGSLHGGGHAISALSIRRMGEDDVGLLRYLDTNGVVDSLHLVDARIEGSDAAGAVVSYNAGTVRSCVVTGSVVGDTTCSAGGIVGFNNVTGRVLSSSFVGDTVSVGSSGYAGGIVGANLGTVANCNASAIVTGVGDHLYLGGLVGFNQASIDSGSAAGRVQSPGSGSDAGGIAGFNGGAIRRSHASATVQANGKRSFAGGLVGFGAGDSIAESWATGSATASDSDGHAGGLVGASNEEDIRRSFATGNAVATGKAAFAGGLVGYDDSGTIVDCFARGDVSGKGGDEVLGGLVGYNVGTLTRTYATGRIAGSVGATIGAVAGFSANPILSSYWDKATSNQGSGVGVTYGSGSNPAVTGLDASQMKLASSFTGWDFDAVWTIGANDSTPTLRSLASSYDASGVRNGGLSRRERASFSWRVSPTGLVVSSESLLDVTVRDVSGHVLGHARGTRDVHLDLPKGAVAVATVRGSGGSASFPLPLP